MKTATKLFEHGNEAPFATEDTDELLARSDDRDAYFWLERGEGEVLELVHVRHEADGFFVRWKDYRRGEFFDAIGRDHRHGLALAYDGGGNPEVIDRACVLGREATAAVIREFATTGGRSEAVAWGRGIVRTEGGHESGWRITEVGARGPRGWLPEALHAKLAGEPDPKRAEAATWRVVEALEVGDARWLSLIAEHPMHCLRELTVEDARGNFAMLAGAVAASPSLERVVVLGNALMTLTPISSPTLQFLQVVLADPEAERELPPDWREQLRARLGEGELPALEVLAIDEDVEDEEYDEDEDEDDEDDDED